jgi:hypothetical protein
MADFVESAKNFVSSAVGRTSWEAQKQMRVRSKQNEIDKLVDQRHKLLDELGQVAMNLYQQGMLSDPQLAGVCAKIMQVDQDVRVREEQLQEVKKENYVGDQPAPGSTTAGNYGTPPYTPPSQPGPAGTGQQPFQGGYDPQNTQGQQPQTQICPTCGSVVRSNALYCRNCGSKMR